jgi:penicillin-binding protein 1A
VLPLAHLGAASFALTLRGPLSDPAALKVEPRLEYESAPEAVRAFQYLRAPFRYTPDERPGQAIQVGAGAPSFVALAEVPPLFVRALLLSEDAGFFGHPGVDVAEIQVAWAENEERGESARGASTITQQLVKNLFLNKDRSYGRKLTEAALALVLDGALPKQRILEIYLNVIEWGPGLYGLGPAAGHYFGKAPFALTPKEMAFLICLIPSPVRYHQAHLAGHPGPGMELLMANLLAKLHSVAALGDAEYDDAMEEPLVFRPEA